MNISEKIIKYADGEMSSREKMEFEKELMNSESLKEQLDSYNLMLSRTEEVTNIPVEESYFASVIPEFRLRQSKRTGFNIYPKFAIGTALIAAMILFFVYFNKGIDTTVTQPVLAEYKTEEIDSLLNYYPQNYNDLDSAVAKNNSYSEIVDSMFLTELNVTEDNIESIASYLPNSEYSQSYSNNISDEEADIIYNEILKKSFF